MIILKYVFIKKNGHDNEYSKNLMHIHEASYPWSIFMGTRSIGFSLIIENLQSPSGVQ